MKPEASTGGGGQRDASSAAVLIARERELLEAQSLPDLLRAIVGGLRSHCQLEAVTLALQDPQHELRHLLLGDGHLPEAFAGVLFVESVLALAPQTRSLAQPWCGHYAGPDHALLFPEAPALASIAILPLVRRGTLVGTLNLGSTDRARFTQETATEDLGHLAAVVALALDNACNAARLVRSGLADYLTGWYSKRYLQARLREEVARSQRYGTEVALVIFDLDHLREINEGSGYSAGDAVIREVANRIEAVIRRSDAAARFGGDEFALLLTGADVAQARLVAERIRKAVSSTPVEIGEGDERGLTLSAGISVLPAGECGGDLKSCADRLIAEAESALYRAKAAGRNQVVGAA
jgi:two-component system cell cycle response regulator